MANIPPFTFKNPDKVLRQLGERLRIHRLARGLTQVELAERAGLSLSTLKLLESKGMGSLQRLLKVAMVLDLDVELANLFQADPVFKDLQAVERSQGQRAPRRKPREV
ncbi:helix-turn-helix domain-containing protein [Persicirhabdus sediminis]|uniref:Helix-turn-helix transcriptional regulator n=1 Tax=Persicirhabdus sediminis TaxID=454144 RepID=A0A8J7MET5_9BACT|nr:helix-turn-helix transcriptional regulator [Persicirhabdus sediminis]MBK1791363.1 helix-turn-helix transcriptional regulator [Persicirhabdus sediminis]